jgi:anti-sigma factor RsiW
MSVPPLSEELLHAYVDRTLEPARQAEVEHYLAERPEVAQRLAAYARQGELLQDAYAHVLEEPVPQRLAAAVDRASSPRLARVASAIGWIVFGGVLGWALRGEAPAGPAAVSPEAELVQRARLAHKIYVAENRRAVEVAASQEQDMIRWLSKRMNAAVRVPDLREFGYEALGGRLLPGVEGPACQIMYQNAEGKRITLYLARADGKPKPLRFGDADQVHVVFWSDGTLAFALSGEVESERLGRIAAAVANQARPRS